jgi:hypothetical protein
MTERVWNVIQRGPISFKDMENMVNLSARGYGVRGFTDNGNGILLVGSQEDYDMMLRYLCYLKTSFPVKEIFLIS